jgi:hypothetical protein
LKAINSSDWAKKDVGRRMKPVIRNKTFMSRLDIYKVQKYDFAQSVAAIKQPFAKANS